MPDLAMLAGIVVKSSLVISAAGLLSLGLRRQSAAFGHALWTMALALCVSMPLVMLLLPAHQVITLPRAAAPAATQPFPLIVALWASGSCLLLLRELLATIGLSRWRRHASPLTSTRWSATLARTGYDHRSLRVLESQHIAGPCTWGSMRPVLLLPTCGEAWPEAARHAALVHELAHIERRDAVSLLVARLACTLYWFNPLVWLAAERIRTLQERACDDAVLRAGATPSDYAQFLLDAAARTSGMSRFARTAIGMTHGSSLRTRIVAILDPHATRSQPRGFPLIAACTSLFVLTMLLATASIAIEPPPLPQIPSTPQLPELPKLPELPVPPTPPVSPVPPERVTPP